LPGDDLSWPVSAQDRTVSALRAIRQELPGLTHYAVLAGEQSRDAWERRRRHLEALGIRVLWFMPGHYGEIERLLCDVIEAASVHPLRRSQWPIRRINRRPQALDLAGVVASLPKDDGIAEAEEFRVDLD
jgi:hypothetical protein